MATRSVVVDGVGFGVVSNEITRATRGVGWAQKTHCVPASTHLPLPRGASVGDRSPPLAPAASPGRSSSSSASPSAASGSIAGIRIGARAPAGALAALTGCDHASGRRGAAASRASGRGSISSRASGVISWSLCGVISWSLFSSSFSLSHGCCKPTYRLILPWVSAWLTSIADSGGGLSRPRVQIFGGIFLGGSG